MEIGIEIDNGKHIGYKIDTEIIKGLYQTFKFEKIIGNCKNLEINLEIPKNERVNSKMSKRDNICVLTMIFDKDNGIQFLVGRDLSSEQLNSLTPEQLPNELKETIFKAYELI